MQEMQVWSLGREDPLEKGNNNQLTYSCLGNPMDREAWWATVHGVTKKSDAIERLNNNNKTKKDETLNVVEEQLL